MAKQKRRSNITSRKHFARLERETLQKRIITISAIIIALIVIGITAFGLIKEGLIDPQQPVVTVGEKEITLREFQTWARFKRFQLVNQYANYYSFMQSFGDESSRSLIENNLRQIQFQLEPFFLGATVMDEIIADVLIRQEAENRGITVSDAEVDKYLAENFFLHFPDGTPTPIPTQEPIATSTLTSLQLTLVPQEPTEEAAPAEEGSTDSEEPEAEEAVTEESDVAPEPTVALPTPTVLSDEAYQTQLVDYLGYINSFAEVTEEELHWMIQADLYQGKLVEALADEIQTEEDQVWARHILVATEQETSQVYERLEAGELFADLALELSTDQGSGAVGGDLGWFGAGQMVAQFEEAAFSLDIGEISEPVESNFGWHVIQALGREVRIISSDRIEQIRQQIFQEWLTETRESTEVVIADNWAEDVPDTPTIPPHLLLPDQ
ncbi:MAG: peptidylprolyl isomerase [Anaerolineales bacterium]|nr:peptidylprolyl isomerase [Chloroflexota bacterium]MBL6981712.1 peptidylprolyl isomerase [Anaerolineales bacterium]